MQNDILLGEPTTEEVVAYFGRLMDNRAAIMREQAKQITQFRKVLDELCANAEPVCDCLEMGQVLQSGKTLRDFRAALNAGWEALPVVPDRAPEQLRRPSDVSVGGTVTEEFLAC